MSAIAEALVNSSANGCRRCYRSRGMSRARTVALGVSLVAASVASALIPTGCLIPDYCILVTAPGRNWCMVMPGAEMWPIGQPELAQPVQDQIFAPPVGCVCFNDTEQMILGQQAPQAAYDQLVLRIELAARNECASLVPLGWDHNCLAGEPNRPEFDTPVPRALTNDCIGSCAYVKDPPGPKTCDEDPNPFECNNAPLPPSERETGAETSAETSDETGDTGGPSRNPDMGRDAP